MKDPDPDIPNIDDLLAAQPLEPDATFCDKTLERLRLSENDESLDTLDELDATLDRLLADQSIEPAVNFADRVFAQLPTEEPQASKKIIQFPTWLATASTIAACAVAAFILLQKPAATSTQTVVASQQQNTSLSLTESQDFDINNDAFPLETNIADNDPLEELEELLIMAEAFSALSEIEGEAGWETLVMLSE